MEGGLPVKAGYIVFSIGLVILVYEIAYLILYFAGYDVTFLGWVDSWGAVAGWTIRVMLFMAAGFMVYWGIKKSRAGGASR